ncbi:MAG: L,D-transpeptidase family protein [Lachnospiraceae bacterium]
MLFSIKADAATIKLNTTSKTIGVGDSYQLKVIGTTKKVTWYVSSSSVASISSTGKVKGKKIGTTVVTAKVGSQKLTCKIVVHKHRYTVKTTKAATCTKTGINTYTCSCKKSYKKTIKAKGHTASNYIVTKQPTKTTDGLKLKKCTVCGVILEKKVILSENKKEQEFVGKYEASKKTKQLIIVNYKGGSDATLSFHEKASDGLWHEVFSTYAYVGRNGINKKKEGDGKTPTGTFNIKMAFGIKANPGTKLPYTKLTNTMYWCEDKAYYNRLVDVSKIKHKCNGEHLISYTGHYNYSMVIDYNSNCVYGKGSAIFLHCTKTSKKTAGCVAIPESKMITLLKKAKPGIKIVIS